MTNARTAKSAREKAAELRAESARQQARRRTSMVGATVLAVIVVIVGVVVLIQTASHQQAAKVAASTAPPAHLVSGGFLVGNANAKVTIELYEDFQCPICREFEQANATTLAALAQAGTARLIYHPIAILDSHSPDMYSTRSLNAAAAVVNADPSAFQKFHDLLYANQPTENTPGLTNAQLIQYAVEAGAPQASVASAVNGLSYSGWTAAVTDASSKRGVTGTPTIYINGKEFKGDWTQAGVLQAAVTAAG